MQKKLDENYIKLSDLGCAAAILSADFKLEFLDKENPKKVLFAFTSTLEIEQIAKAYWNNDFKIDAQTYFNNIKRLKNQLYSI